MAPSSRQPKRRVDGLYVGSFVFVALAVLFLYVQWSAHQQLVAELALKQEDNRRVADQLAQVKTATAQNLKEYDRLSALVAVQEKPPRPTAKEDALTAGRFFVADHPEAKELVRSAMVALAQSWPARAGRAAGFSDEQIGQWMELFARQKGAPFSRVSGVAPEFGDLDPQEAQGKRLQAIVGDELFARYEAMRVTSYGRSVTAQIADRAESLGAPLRLDQIQALAAVFGKANLNDSAEWDRSRKELDNLLSPEQQAVFEEEAAVRRAMEDESDFREAFLSGRK